jgi:hypothetical protein
LRKQSAKRRQELFGSQNNKDDEGLTRPMIHSSPAEIREKLAWVSLQPCSIQTSLTGRQAKRFMAAERSVPPQPLQQMPLSMSQVRLA